MLFRSLRSDWQRSAARLFERYDALILPTAQCWPFDIKMGHPTRINEVPMDTYHRWMEVVVPVSLLGLPSVAVPAGFGDEGLPIGVQMFGAHGRDRALLALAQQYHEATDWPNRRPPPGPNP